MNIYNVIIITLNSGVAWLTFVLGHYRELFGRFMVAISAYTIIGFNLIQKNIVTVYENEYFLSDLAENGKYLLSIK